MKKIYLIIAGVFLILLVITTMLLSLIKKPSTGNQQNSPFPTSVPVDSATQRTNQQGNNPQVGQQTNSNPLVNPSSSALKPINNAPQNINDLSFDASSIAPVETSDFKLRYSPQLNKMVVEKKSPDAEQKFNDWAKQNNYSQLIGNSNYVSLLLPGQAPPDTKPLLDFINIFMNLGRASEQSSPYPIPSSTLQPSDISPTPINNKSNNDTNRNQSKVYYAQCGDLGEIPLPDGCNLCQAGCGPTAVSMIASSYLDEGHDPKTIVNLYKKNNYLLGCDGSRYSDAYQILSDLKLTLTTNPQYITFNFEKSDTVAPYLRKYIEKGWTFFTLASFCEGGCGHYFWITDIDDKGNIWAYDPAYGRYEIPYNENTRYPYPLYRLAFGVKK